MFWNRKSVWNLTTILMTITILLVIGIGSIKADFIFREPVRVVPLVNSGSAEWGASFSSDGLELYFSTWQSGSYNLWVTSRATTEDNWGFPASLGNTVNSSDDDDSPSISVDGLELYFMSKRSGGYGKRDLWVTKRATTDDPWDTPENLGSIVNSSLRESYPCISANGLELYFGSDQSGDWKVWVTKRTTKDEPWGTPVSLSSVINTVSEAYPSISADGLTLFFGSSRSGGYGSGDIWMTRRATIDAPWAEPVNLGPTINSSKWEAMPTLSHDESIFCFTSNRSGGPGGWDLWQTTIEPIVDLNADGIVDAADMCIVVDYWGTDEPLCDIGPAPFGDGIVDVQDLIVLAEHLFEEFPLVEPVE